MVPWVGFNSTPLYYNRDERFAGVTKYPLSKMLKLASDGILSFSTKPIKFIHVLAGFLMLLAITIGIIGLFWYNGFLLCLISGLILFIGALQLFAIGTIGEYVGRIFEEVKNRPIYIIKEKLNI